MSAYHGPLAHSECLLYWFLFLYTLVPVAAVNVSSNTSGFVWSEIDSVTLECIADSTDVRYSWTLKGKPLPQEPRYLLSQNDSILTISPVALNNSGPFVCTASNSMNNETSKELNLNLAWYPAGNTACTAESVGQNIQLGCSWPEGWPSANVTMKFGKETRTGQSHVFTNVTSVNTIRGSSLTCVGDQLGRTSACTIAFELPQSTGYNGSSVTIVTAGDIAVMTLNLTQSDLPVVFTWYRLNSNSTLASFTSKYTTESTNSSSSLQISDVDVMDAGQYECSASNIVGNQTFRFTLNVTEQGSSIIPTNKNHVVIIVTEIAVFMALFAFVAICVVKRSKGQSGVYGNSLPSICEKAVAGEQMKQKSKAV